MQNTHLIKNLLLPAIVLLFAVVGALQVQAAGLATFRLETDLVWPDDGPAAVTAKASGQGILDERGRLLFTVRLAEGRLTLPVLRSEFTGTARGVFDGNGLTLEDAALNLRNPELLLADRPSKLPDGQVRLSSMPDTDGNAPMRLNTDIRLGNALHAEGVFELGTRNNTVRLKFASADARRLARLLPGLKSDALHGTLKGRLLFTGFSETNRTTDNSAMQPAWIADCGSSLNGTVETHGIRIRRPALDLKARGGSGPGNRSWIEIDEAVLRFPGKNRTTAEARFTAEGRMKSNGPGPWTLSRATFRLPKHGRLDAGSGPGNTAPLKLAGTLDAAGLFALLADSSLLPAETVEWTPTGTLTVNAHAAQSGTTRPFAAHITLRNSSFISPDVTYMGENLGFDLRIKGRTRPGSSEDDPMQGTTLSAALNAKTGGALLGPVLMDFAAHPLDISARLAPDRKSGNTTLAASARIKGTDRPLVDARLDARIDRLNNSRTSFTLNRTDIGTVFRDFFAPALSMDTPLNLFGTAALRLNASGDLDTPETWDITGQLDVADGSLSMGNSTRLADVNAILPVHIQPAAPRTPADEIPERTGRLTTGPGQFGPVTVEPIDLRIAMPPAGLSTKGEIVLKMFGAVLYLDSLRCDDPFGRGTEMELSARLENLDFSALPAGAVPLQGRLSSGPLYVQYEDDLLDVYGSLTGTFFGGELDIRDMEVHRPFTEGQTIHTDLDVTGLDLEPLSKALGVGRITGRVNLEMDDFTAAYGQPAGFRLKIESAKDKTTDRTVSLQAVNSLSVIGTGSGLTGMGVELFASLFKEFNYSRIGMACSLNNDLFRIRGLVRDGGVEYLIKKPLFFGVNVVNSNPDNVISFSDMLERVRRVVRPDAPDSTPPSP